MDELNPTWVKSTLLAILKGLAKVTEGLHDVRVRLRKVEIGQEVTHRQLEKLVGRENDDRTEIASLNRAFDRHEERIDRLEEKAGLSS